jgi:predicted phosphodiesterase
MTNGKILQRVGAVGDIHGEAKSLKLILEFFSNSNLDCIFSVGDIIDGQNDDDVEECLQLLQAYKVLTVKGNHERWLLTGVNYDLQYCVVTKKENLSAESQNFIYRLPVIREFDTTSGKLLLCHGLGFNDMAGVWPGDYGYALEANLDLLKLTMEQRYRFVINGHTHRRMVRKFDNLTIINAGTLVPVQEPCFFIADFVDQIVQFYDVKENNIIKAQQIAIN